MRPGSYNIRIYEPFTNWPLPVVLQAICESLKFIVFCLKLWCLVSAESFLDTPPNVGTRNDGMV